MKIGIIEDHELIADLLATICRRDFKYDVVLLEKTGQQGLMGIRMFRPDLVLLDISLPDMDGLYLAGEVRREFPSTKILALSSLRDPVTLKQAYDLGIHG